MSKPSWLRKVDRAVAEKSAPPELTVSNRCPHVVIMGDGTYDFQRGREIRVGMDPVPPRVVDGLPFSVVYNWTTRQSGVEEACWEIVQDRADVVIVSVIVLNEIIYREKIGSTWLLRKALSKACSPNMGRRAVSQLGRSLGGIVSRDYFLKPIPRD